MPRLKSLPPRLTSMPPRLGRAVGDEKARRREREINTPNRSWYHSARWKKLRLKVFERDSYTCKQTAALCLGQHPAPNSPVCDHVKPHHWDEQLFWDIDNLQTVTKAYHDSEKQKQERAQPGW
ncbi:endonuclease [Rhizobium sp. Leaf306]|nr:endonuclease [Rhizobium sp. Leaf306]